MPLAIKPAQLNKYNLGNDSLNKCGKHLQERRKRCRKGLWLIAPTWLHTLESPENLYLGPSLFPFHCFSHLLVSSNFYENIQSLYFHLYTLHPEQ